MADVTVQGEFPDSGAPARLDLTFDPSARTVLDGAWWPRSRDSASELAGLVAALDAKDAPVGLIMLNPYGWLSHPRRVQAADRTVRIAWIADLDPMVVIGTASRDRRIDLLLVAPQTAPSIGPETSLRGSIAATTRALAEIGNEPPGVWVEGVRAALLVLYGDFRNEEEVVLHILTATPRLAHAVAQLNRERADIGVLFDRALAHVAQPAPTVQVDRIHAQVSSMLQQLARHQQHGADLLHEADQVDIGGQG